MFREMDNKENAKDVQFLFEYSIISRNEIIEKFFRTVTVSINNSSKIKFYLGNYRDKSDILITIQNILQDGIVFKIESNYYSNICDFFKIEEELKYDNHSNLIFIKNNHEITLQQHDNIPKIYSMNYKLSLKELKFGEVLEL